MRFRDESSMIADSGLNVETTVSNDYPQHYTHKVLEALCTLSADGLIRSDVDSTKHSDRWER